MTNATLPALFKQVSNYVEQYMEGFDSRQAMRNSANAIAAFAKKVFIFAAVCIYLTALFSKAVVNCGRKARKLWERYEVGEKIKQAIAMTNVMLSNQPSIAWRRAEVKAFFTQCRLKASALKEQAIADYKSVKG